MKQRNRVSSGVLLSAFFAVFLLAGCDSPERQAEVLEKQISSYRTEASDEKRQAIRDGFQKLDAEIEDLKSHGKTLRAQALQQQRDQLMAQFTAAQVGQAVNQATDAMRNLGGTLKEAGESFIDTLRSGNSTESNEE
jgi:FtsZ-binding cell division protein ZapB